MRRLIIGCPFGNYIRLKGATSTLGTFTPQRRGGHLLRLWRFLKTARPKHGGWVSRLGLPSPSIDELGGARGKIVSVHAFEPHQWHDLAWDAYCSGALAVELNLSCPNVAAVGLEGLEGLLRVALLPVIAKLSPVSWGVQMGPLWDMGVHHFHLCNALSAEEGSLSGPPCKWYALGAVRECRRRFGKRAVIIGGGGVWSVQDAKDYLEAGADHVALASIFLNPLRWGRVRAIRRLLEKA